MSSMDATYGIWAFPKLKGSDTYRTWQRNMKAALKFESLWDTLDYQQSYPNDLPEEQFVMEGDPPVKRITVAGPSDAAIRAHKLLQKEWAAKNNKASQLILSKCNDRTSDHIEDEELASNMWITLENLYMDSGFTSRHTLLQQLMATTISSCDNSVETYTTTIRSKAKDLRRMGATLDDWVIVSVLLNNLEGKFKDFVHRTVTALPITPDLEVLISTLYEEERLSKRDQSSSAMAAQMRKFQKEQANKSNNRGGGTNRGGGRPRGRGGSNSNAGSVHPNDDKYIGEGDPPECSACSKGPKGPKKHWKGNYWTLHPELRPNKGNKPKANTASGDKEKEKEEETPPHAGWSMVAHLNSNHEARSAYYHGTSIGVEDNEFWGVTGSGSTPNLGVNRLPEVRTLAKLATAKGHKEIETDFTKLISTTLKSSPKLAHKRSREEIELSSSPAPLVNLSDEIIDYLSHESSTHVIAYAAAKGLSTPKTVDWLMDSGCTHHMYHDKDAFTDYTDYRAGITITDGTVIWTSGRGTIVMK